MARGVVIVLCVLLVAAAPAAGRGERAAACPTSLANQLADTGDAVLSVTVDATAYGFSSTFLDTLGVSRPTIVPAGPMRPIAAPVP